MKLFTVAEMISAEKAAHSTGHSYSDMMERAGKGVADAINARHPVADQHVLILIGPGNNGGDGLVAARHLALAGASVVCYLLKPRDPAQDDNFAQVQAMSLRILHAAQDHDFNILRSRLSSTEILIDALLGTGVSRPIQGQLADLLKTIHLQLSTSQHAPQAPSLISLSPQLPGSSTSSTSPFLTVAIDAPSGLNCDTGALDPLALSAELTVTFAGPKQGHFAFPGAVACGELVVVDIGIDPALTAQLSVDVATAAVARLLPTRPLDGHKGTFGTVLVIGGCAHYLGAPILSAMAAYRSGAGVVALAVPQQLRLLAATHLPEATFPLVADDAYFSEASIAALDARFAKSAALLVGPGLGEHSAEFLSALFAQPTLPTLVIDADALNYLARQPEWWTQIRSNNILTPHPGEMSRLVGRDTRAENRVMLAREMAQKWQQIVVLKGAFTVVAQPDGQATLIPIATPALAVAGSGDVLAGTIVGLLAQKVPPYEAAVAGAYCHALAGQQLAQHNGSSGTLASEIAHQLPQVMQQLRTA